MRRVTSGSRGKGHKGLTEGPREGSEGVLAEVLRGVLNSEEGSEGVLRGIPR